jgi:NADH:ubiquinone oxidoreductase subunit F (NADH-binding)
VKRLIERLLDGQGRPEDIERILQFCSTIAGLTLCPTGSAFAVPIRAMVEKYRPEFEALLPRAQRRRTP